MFANTRTRIIVLFIAVLALLALGGCSASPGQAARAVATAMPEIIDATDAYEAALPPTPTPGCVVCSGGTITTTGSITTTGTLNLPAGSGAPTAQTAQPTSAANSGAPAPTAMPSAPSVQPTAAAPAASAPAPTTFDPQNPTNPVTITVDLPDGWGQEDRMKTGNEIFGHRLMITFMQAFNPTTGQIDANSNIQIGAYPTKAVKVSNGWELSFWLNNDLMIERWFEMANEQVARAQANGGTIPVPPTYLIDGDGTIWVSINSDGTWQQTDKLPDGLEVVDATFDLMPELDAQACPATDAKMESFTVYVEEKQGDLPLGDADLGVYGYIYPDGGDPMEAVYFAVQPDLVLWIPQGYTGAKLHYCELPGTLKPGTMIIDSKDDTLTVPANWTADDGYGLAAPHVTLFNPNVDPTP